MKSLKLIVFVMFFLFVAKIKTHAVTIYSDSVYILNDESGCVKFEDPQSLSLLIKAINDLKEINEELEDRVDFLESE